MSWGLFQILCRDCALLVTSLSLVNTGAAWPVCVCEHGEVFQEWRFPGVGQGGALQTF